MAQVAGGTKARAEVTEEGGRGDDSDGRRTLICFVGGAFAFGVTLAVSKSQSLKPKKMKEGFSTFLRKSVFAKAN